VSTEIEAETEPDTGSSLRIGQFALSAEIGSSTWIVDSGASHHMYNGARGNYTTYGRLPSPIVIGLGDESSVKSTRHGTLLEQRYIAYTYLSILLLPVGEFDTRGYTTKFGNGKCSFQGPQNADAMTGSQNGRLYQVDPNRSDYQHGLSALLSSVTHTPKLSTTESHLWHRCLGHLNHISMRSLVDSYIYAHGYLRDLHIGNA